MAQRGLVIIGDMNQMSDKSKVWKNFISWGSSKKLVQKF
jgi:hypothetical protein